MKGIVYSWTQKKFCSSFLYFRPIWIGFGTEDSHKNLLSNCEFRENRRSEIHTLLMDVNAFLSAISTLWVEFGTTDQHVMLLEIVGFGENLDKEILTFLTGIIENTFTHVE